MRYTCDHSADRTSMCITCMNYEAKLESCEMLSETTMGSICCQYHRAEALEKELESLRAEVAVLKSANVLSHANDYLRNENSRLKAEVERLKKAETDLDAQLAVQANEPTTKTDGYMAGLLNGMLLAKANFGHEYHPISYNDAQLSRLRSALERMIEVRGDFVHHHLPCSHPVGFTPCELCDALTPVSEPDGKEGV